MWIKVSDKELVNANQLGCIVYKYNEVVSTIGNDKLVLYNGYYARDVYDKIMEAIENNKTWSIYQHIAGFKRGRV